jgi:centromere/kinetochore protein ZW10
LIHPNGYRYLYNDSTYLAEQLAEFSATWKTRDDITTRAQNMLRLDNDIKSLQSFANRAYTNELAIQKTVLRDLLGGMPLFYPPIHPQLHTNKDLPHSQEN